MNTPPSQQDGRRLYPRYRIAEVDELLRYSTPANPASKSSAKVFEIAKDSMTCKLALDVAIPVGTKISLELLQNGSKKILEGKVASCKNQPAFTRLGILFSQSNIFSFFPSVKANPSFGQRKAARRSENSAETGKREFERRGLWPGLLSKRWASNYAWQLQNKNEYFYMKSLQTASGAHVIVNGQKMIMMSSNNYLGLTTHPKTQEAAISAIKKFGTGAGASAILGGLLDIHLELEETVAKFEGVEAACLFNSGYVANITTLLTILQKGDTVLNDELSHASLLDGSRLSKADFLPFHHLNMEDLNLKLSKSQTQNKMVVTDGVFSMDGDISPLPEIFRLCKKYGAALMIDEAHSTGVFGKRGRGLLEHFGLRGKADVVIGTMSKSLAASGGFVGGSKEFISIIKHTARGSMFTTNISPVICAVALAAFKLIDEEPERRQALWRNANHLRSGLQALGFNTANTKSPIIPVLFSTENETMLATKHLRECGIFASPVIFPAVKKNQTRVRLSVMATHTEEDIEKVLSAFKSIPF